VDGPALPPEGRAVHRRPEPAGPGRRADCVRPEPLGRGVLCRPALPGGRAAPCLPAPCHSVVPRCVRRSEPLCRPHGVRPRLAALPYCV